MKNKIFVIFFALLLSLLTISNIVAPKKEFSDNENRVLKQFPDFSWEALKDGSFTADFAEYLADQFILRDMWVSIKSFGEQALLKKENNGVYKSSKGMLLDSFDESATINFDKNIQAVKDFEALMKEQNVSVKTLIAPTATQIYPESLPKSAPIEDFKPLLEKLSGLPSFVNVFDTLTEKREEYIYYKTDHHWTNLGAYYAYSEYMDSIGLKAKAYEDYNSQVVADEFYGTLYSRYGQFMGIEADTVYAPSSLPKMSVKDSKNQVTDSIYHPEKLSEKDKYLYFLGGNDSIVTIETESNTGRNLLLIKDSYANSFLPYLTETFDKIIVIDMRYYMGLVPFLAEAENITDALILYNIKSFGEEKTIEFINYTE